MGLVGVGSPAVAAANQTLPRIRSSSASLAALIARVTKHSATFRALIDAIDASDGIVYVEAGECGHDVTACLVGVTSAGAYRMLWIKVDKDSGSATSSHRSATNYSTQWKSRVTQTSSAALECFPITSGWDGEEVVHSSSKRPQPPMRASR